MPTPAFILPTPIPRRLHSNPLRRPRKGTPQIPSRPPPPRNEAATSSKNDPPPPPPPPIIPAPTTSITRQILALALPALGALALDPLLSLIDTAFVGRLGASALAGIGISTIVLNVSFSVFNFLSISTTPLVARAISRDSSPSAASSTISCALLVAAVIGSVSAVTLITFAPAICSGLGATAESLPLAVDYLRFRAFASPFALGSFVLNGALRGFRDLRTPFIVALVANSANIVLDLLLIFSYRLGLKGAALATSISQILALILMLAHLVRTKRLLPRDIVHIPAWKDVKPLLNAGALLTIRTMSLLVTVAYATATAAKSGVVALAAYELCRQLWVFKATILDSLATSAQSLIATAIQQPPPTARRIANRAVQLSSLLGLIISVIAISLHTRLPRIFTSDQDVISLSTRCIRMAAICAPLNGAVFALDGILAAVCDYRYMACGIALAAAVSCAVLWAVRIGGGDVVAVWGGLNVLMICRGVVLGWRYLGSGSPIPKTVDR